MTRECRSLAPTFLLVAAMAVLAGCGRRQPPAPKPVPPPPVPAVPEKKPAPDSATTQATASHPAPSETTPSPEATKPPEGPAPAGSEKKLRRVKVLVSGRVQGVGFRAFTVSKANALGLTGTVRNLKDGRVEAFVEGPSDKVDELVKAMGTGPAGARVDGVLTEEQTHSGKFKGFVIER
jgi:acylphosphatase